MSESITVTLNEDDIEVIRLNMGLRLHVVKGLNKPVLLTAADGKDWVSEVVEVVHFYRPWISRVLGTRRCSGTLKVRDIGSKSEPRFVYFINAHPWFGYRFAWDNEDDLFNTTWDQASLGEKLHLPRKYITDRA